MNAICKLNNDDKFKIIYFRSFDGDNFETVASSTCNHEWTLGLANYRGSPMTTGSRWTSDCYVKTEVYNFTTNQWKYVGDYPFSS